MRVRVPLTIKHFCVYSSVVERDSHKIITEVRFLVLAHVLCGRQPLWELGTIESPTQYYALFVYWQDDTLPTCKNEFDSRIVLKAALV